MEEGANGPPESCFYDDFFVEETYIPVPVEINEVTTVDEKDPDLAGWTGVENHCMCTGEADAALPSFWETLGSTK